MFEFMRAMSIKKNFSYYYNTVLTISEKLIIPWATLSTASASKGLMPSAKACCVSICKSAWLLIQERSEGEIIKS
jgi:hypothetical protein